MPRHCGFNLRRLVRGEKGQGDERMRGYDDLQEGMFGYISPEKRVPTDHPLRPIRNVGPPRSFLTRKVG